MTTAHERKQQERHARRRRIQRAARSVFAEKGYAKTSIEQIAREASLSVGAIYLYFRSKEDLYVSLLEETLELFDAELTQIRERGETGNSGDPSDGLRAAWTFLAQWATTDIEATCVLRLISQPNIRKQLSDEVAEAIASGIGRLREHVTAIIEMGVRDGRFHASDAGATVDLFWALFLGSLEANDARVNLALPGGTLADLNRSALTALMATLGERESMSAHAAA
jgi:AcrR family transcriptional regulator